jgi:transposase InsO family protein
VKLQDVVDGMKVSDNSKPDCNTCVLGKMTQSRNRNPDIRSKAPLELVHTDLAGPIDPMSKEGFRYTIAFTDDYSGVVFVYFLKNKSDTVEATKKFLADSAPYGSVKCLRSDNGGEFISGKFKTLLSENKIKHETSAPYSPHQNGTAERHWRTLFEMGRCMLIQANLGKPLWPYAVMAAAFIRNRCYNNRLKQTPYYALTGRRPNLANMRVFGSECYAYEQDKQKLDPRCKKGVFVGFDKGSPAYLVYFPDTGKVLKYRLVKFITKSISEQQTQTEEVTNVDFRLPLDRNGPDGASDIPNPEIAHEGRDSQTERSSESDQQTEASDEGKGDVNSESDQEDGSKHLRRERRPPSYLNDYVTNVQLGTDHVLSSVDYCYKMSGFPQTYQEAMESADADLWKAAMEEEMNSLNENNTFTLTALPDSRQAVGGKWVYTIKESPSMAKTYKARYVAKGYSQIKDIDYHETFAPTANLTTVRALMQIAAKHDLILHQMDVKTAYLNAPIDCEIYIEQAEGFETPSNSGEKLVYKLNKSLYGLKQSGRNWNSMLHKYLIENGFMQSDVDHCLYIKDVDGKLVVVLVWVDDLIIAASNDILMSETKQMLKDKFHMKDLGKLSYFLGMSFEQGADFVKMNQKRYLTKLLERFEMSDCKSRATPSEPKLECDGESLVDSRKYRELVGSLIYAMTCTRPDICWIITTLSQYLSRPLEQHWVAAKHVLRYLKGTLDFELCYRKCDDDLRLVGYSDADWASDTHDRRSISGYCFSLTLNGPLISWKSKKQRTVALSSCEAEYIALAATIQEALYLAQLLAKIIQIATPVQIYEDNQGTIALSKDPVNRKRSKHIDV